MADAYWKVGNTRPSVLITLDLGIDPQTGDPRTLVVGDVVTQLMRRATDAVITRTLTIVDLPTNKVLYKPAVGDFTQAGDYQVEFDITASNGDVETIPDRVSANYVYTVGAKLG